MDENIAVEREKQAYITGGHRLTWAPNFGF